MGKYTHLFRWSHWLHLRIPARYLYVVSLSIGMLGWSGLTELPSRIWPMLILLQAWDLIANVGLLIPIHPFVQRWDWPERVRHHPLRPVLHGLPGRVSGLPYPHRTGYFLRVQTLRYNGHSRTQRMATLRPQEGGHDWFEHQSDGPALDQYGIQWAVTMRPLRGKWESTTLPHLYRNTHGAVR